MGDLLARATRRITLAHIRHVTPITPGAARGPIAEVYRQVERDFGMLAPPIALHSPAVGPLAAAWVMLRETLLVAGHAARQDKETVAAAVSLANTCPYCVDIHGAALTGLAPDPDGPALIEGQVGAVTDPRLAALARWGRSAASRGPGGRGPLPFTAPQAPDLIGVAVVFHYLNRMVNVFLRDSPLPPVPPAARAGARRVAARVMGSLARHEGAPGLSLNLLPAAELPADLSWAAGSVAIADAFARAAVAIEDADHDAVPEPVREVVRQRLADWTGESPGLSSQAWLTEPLAELAERDRPAGRFALLTTFASYRVTDSTVEDLRAVGYGDAELIQLACWASLAAARWVGEGLGRDLAALGTPILPPPPRNT